MNVFEDGEEMVTRFVKANGAGMSYPVVYTYRQGFRLRNRVAQAR